MNHQTTLSHHMVLTRSLLAVTTLTAVVGCAGTPEAPPKTIYESGRNQVRIVKDPDSTSNTHPASLTPLVGRYEEISVLLRRWQQAKNGEGQVILLSGDPGIGKSRLVRELQARLT